MKIGSSPGPAIDPSQQSAKDKPSVSSEKFQALVKNMKPGDNSLRTPLKGPVLSPMNHTPQNRANLAPAQK
ncbi:hypothetical protein [uncultured Endozoicomonas sp.]|uniref:hypothetical protein n=1 Tax=uncultured Endozoicomonas sp. TaxID=432652 RepID=UPI002605EFB6|nr:hypothetical protein [uncultured Endozoicomonas sp.]